MKDAPLGKYNPEPKSVAVRKSGSNTTPRPDGVKTRGSGSNLDPRPEAKRSKSTIGDKERPVIREVRRKDAPWRKPGNSTHTANTAK